MGSPAVAAFIGFWAFWILLPYGYGIGELSRKQVVLFLILWICGRIGLASLPAPGPALFSPYVAILDIALVFVIFQSDVRLN
jgi:hypothetical protein